MDKSTSEDILSSEFYMILVILKKLPSSNDKGTLISLISSIYSLTWLEILYISLNSYIKSDAESSIVSFGSPME